MRDFYKKLKTKQGEREIVHGVTLMNIVTSMFEYSNIPKGLDVHLMERILASEGKVGIVKRGEEVLCFIGDYSGDVTPRMRGKDFTGAMVNLSVSEEVFEPENNLLGKCVVGWNNSNMTPNVDLPFFAELLANIDISMRSNIRFARYNPILKARDNKDKALIEEVLRKNEDGDLSIIVSDNFKADFFEKEDIEKIEIFNVDKIEKIQYLSKFHEDVISRFLFNYGMDYSNGTKLAQQSVSEVKDGDKASMILPYNMLNERKKMVEKINECFDVDMSVDFSDSWKIQREEIASEPQAEPQVEPQVETQVETQEEKEVE